MAKLKPYTRPDSYFGATWYGYYPIVGQSRDSTHLEASNFAVAWKMLSALQSEYTATDNDPNDNASGEILDTVVRTVCNHWAVDWVETLYIHESNAAAKALAQELVDKLEDYPALSDDDLSEREWNAATEYWERSSVKGRLEILRSCRSNVSMFAARHDSLPQDDNGSIFDYCRE